MGRTIADVTIEHTMPGRVRLRFKSKRKDLAFFEKLVGTISEFAAVDSIDANPQTGSVLIRHSATDEELIRFASLIGLFDTEKFARPSNGEAVLAPTGFLSKATLGLLVLAFVQALRGRVLGSASEQLWLASRLSGMNHFAVQLALIGLAVFQLLNGRALGPSSSLLSYALMTEALIKRAPKVATKANRR